MTGYAFRKRISEKELPRLARVVRLGSPQAPSRGFTLLELLIVIAMLAILAVILILILNPAETLRRARDSQRLSDLSTLKSALAMYILRAPNPDLDLGGDGVCGANIWIGRPPGSVNITDETVFGRTLAANGDRPSAAIDSTGWIPVNFTEIPEGSPIAALPLDPNYSVADPTNLTSTDRFYSYTCNSDNVFEFNANMESVGFSQGGSDDKESSDGGDHTGIFEIGTKLSLLAGQWIVTINTDFDGHAFASGVCDNIATSLRISGSADNRRTYIRFPLTALPAGSTVTDVKLRVNVAVTGDGALDIQAYNINGQADPAVDACATRYARSANDSTPYVDETNMAVTTGIKTIQLPQEAYSDVQNAKSAADRFAISINEGATSSIVFATLDSIETSGTDEPKLIISYTE